MAAALLATSLAGCAGEEGGAHRPTGGAAASPTGVSTSASPASAPTRGEGSAASQEGRLVDDASWVGRGGERALRVSPSARLRDSTDPEVYDEAWRRVVRAVPEADSPGMRDQFVCHATFASQKEAWYLEPARPAVGYWRTVRAGCNPGDVRDVG